MNWQDRIFARISTFCLLGLLYRSFTDRWNNSTIGAIVCFVLVLWAAIGVYFEEK